MLKLDGVMQVGAVLGKGGATISQIRSDSGATVRLVGLDPDEERHLPRDLGSGQHRVISIAGDPDCALRALAAVTDLLQECQVPSSAILTLQSSRYTIHANL